jgi:hypothetical protein
LITTPNDVSTVTRFSVGIIETFSYLIAGISIQYHINFQAYKDLLSESSNLQALIDFYKNEIAIGIGE